MTSSSTESGNAPKLEPVDQRADYSGEPYADISQKDVKTFVECKKAGGAISNQGSPERCYFDEVIYYAIIPGHEYLNPPENLKTYKDCLRGHSKSVSVANQSCTSWIGKTFYYDGPQVKTFEDCVKAVGNVLESNPPQCFGPDGKLHWGPTS